MPVTPPKPAPRRPEGAAAPARPQALAVIDMGSSGLRLVVAEVGPGGEIRVLERAARAIPLGKDTFAAGRISAPTMEAAVRACEGFRRIMEGYEVTRCRAVATSAVREASNRDLFLDRIRVRTGIRVEVIDGSEENRLTYAAVRAALGDRDVLASGNTLLVEVGGGSADVTYLVSGTPTLSGTYPLGAIRMRQIVGSSPRTHAGLVRLLRRHIRGVVEDVKREMPLREATHFVALGGDIRFAASRLGAQAPEDAPVREVRKEDFVPFCELVSRMDVGKLVEDFGLPMVEAETLVPSLLAYRDLLLETAAETITVPEATLRDGLLLETSRPEGSARAEDVHRQVLASAAALGEKYRYDAPHARKVADLAVRLFDELAAEHGLAPRDRLLLEVAALLHDIGAYVHRQSHHKHSLYLLSASEIFGLTREDMTLVANVARYHRRATPQMTHLAYAGLDREARVRVNKLAALLRVADALDADHVQKVKDLRFARDGEAWVLEVQGAGDLTMERLATLARSDLLTETFGKPLAFREAAAEA